MHVAVFWSWVFQRTCYSTSRERAWERGPGRKTGLCKAVESQGKATRSAGQHGQIQGHWGIRGWTFRACSRLLLAAFSPCIPGQNTRRVWMIERQAASAAPSMGGRKSPSGDEHIWETCFLCIYGPGPSDAGLSVWRGKNRPSQPQLGGRFIWNV